MDITYYVVDSFMRSHIAVCTIVTKSSAIAEIVQVDVHYVVQGHSRSLILVPIESPYASSY